MKRYNNLYPKICDIANIEQAFINASKGKTKRKNVQKILKNKEFYILEIKKMLKNKIYIPSPYVEKTIKDNSSNKERIIHKPRFYPDQIIHWCLMQIIEPLLHKRMYKWSCSSIKGRGTYYGVKYIKKVLKDKRNTKYVFKCDIRKFYPSVDLEILKAKFRKVFKDNNTLWLIDTIIDSHNKGLPIGNYTSQWFANFYLLDVDNYIKEQLKIKYYCRYADDLVLFSSNKRKLHLRKNELKTFIESENLNLKPNYQLYPHNKRFIDFLGFRFYKTYSTIRRYLYIRIIRRIAKIKKKIVMTLRDAGAIISYYGFIKHSNSFNVYQNIKYNHLIKQSKERLKYENHNKRLSTTI